MFVFLGLCYLSRMVFISSFIHLHINFMMSLFFVGGDGFVCSFCSFVCLRHSFSVWPWLSGTSSVNQAGLELRDLLASAFQVLELKMCTTKPSLMSLFLTAE